MNGQISRLQRALEAIEGMEARLELSLTEDATHFPVTASTLVAPSSEIVKTIDAFLKRFEQATDHLLRKLFPSTVAAIEASAEPLPFRDVLDRLDRYALIDDPATWVALNDLRNRLVHEYALSKDELAADISAAWRMSPILLDQITKIRSYVAEHHLLSEEE